MTETICYNEEEINNMCKDIASLSLRQLKVMPKQNLMQIILTREVSFNNLRDEWREVFKQNLKDEFILKKINIAFDENPSKAKLLKYTNSLYKQEKIIRGLRNELHFQKELKRYEEKI